MIIACTVGATLLTLRVIPAVGCREPEEDFHLQASCVVLNSEFFNFFNEKNSSRC